MPVSTNAVAVTTQECVSEPVVGSRELLVTMKTVEAFWQPLLLATTLYCPFTFGATSVTLAVPSELAMPVRMMTGPPSGGVIVNVTVWPAQAASSCAARPMRGPGATPSRSADHQKTWRNM